MIFPIWWESHKSPWFQTTNQLGCDNSHCSTLKWINKHFLNPSWHYVNNACNNGLMILLEPHVLIRVLWICPGLLGTLPCVVGLISSFYDLSNIFGSYLVNSSGSFLASPSDMEPPQEWSVLTICPKIWIFQPQLPWRSNGCCQGSLSSAFFGGEWIPPKLSFSIIGQTVYSLEGKSHCFWLKPSGNQIWHWNIHH